MRPMLGVLFGGAAVSAATIVSGTEAIAAFTPFTVLSTAVLLFAYWMAADDHTPARNRSHYKKAA